MLFHLTRLLLRQQRLFVLLFVLALALVSYTCLIPLDGPVVDLPQFDKVLHFTAYLGLAVLFERAFPRYYPTPGVALLISYSAIIELIQGQTAYRSADLLDLLANSAGAASYLLICGTIRRFVAVESGRG